MSSLTLYLRTTLPPPELLRAVPVLLASIDPNVAVTSLTTPQQRIRDSAVLDRTITLLFVGCAVLAALFPPLDSYVRGAAWLLMVVVGLVLLLACTNLASFLLARAVDRRKEVAVRLVLGASRWSLVRRLLIETTLLSPLAGGAGVGLAVWLLDLLVTADLPLPTPVTLDLRPDGNVLAFTFGVAVVAGALLGLVPAQQSTRPDVASALRSESAGAAGPVSSGGATRWSSRNSRFRCCCSSAPACSFAAFSGRSRSTRASATSLPP